MSHIDTLDDDLAALIEVRKVRNKYSIGNQTCLHTLDVENMA